MEESLTQVQTRVRTRTWWAPVGWYLSSRLVIFATLAALARMTHRSLQSLFSTWDSRWYLDIAQHGYATHIPHVGPHLLTVTRQTDLGFFPLLPVVIRIVHALTGLSFVASGIAATFLTGLSASLALWFMVKERLDGEAATRAVALMVFSPAAVVLSLVYSEGLTITFGALTLWALSRHRWHLAGGLAALASLSDPVSSAIIIVCVVAAYRASRYERDYQAWWAALIAPSGLVLFFSYLWVHAHTPFAWFDAQRAGWQSGPLGTGVFYSMFRFVTSGFSDVNSAVKSLSTLVVVMLAVEWWRRRRAIPADWTTQAAATVLFGALSPIVSLSPRLVLRGFALFAGSAELIPRRYFERVLMVSALVMVLLTMLSTTLAWTP
ncbi:MAG: hypothetical protein KGR42_03840 [Acidobacteria bacterium]|nr:hypothetical protein [Acidobacteriota bacterium]